MKLACGAVGLLLAGFALAAPSPDTEEATKSKATYTQKLQELTQECAAAKTVLLARYRKALDTLRTEAKQRGDLDAVQVVDLETQRFDKKKTLPPANPPSASSDLAKTVTLCLGALDKAELDNAQKVLDLTDRYVQFLDLRVKQAVRDDKLDLAKAFNAEMKSARETPAYQAAKFLIADKTAATESVKAETPADLAPAAVDPGKTHPAAATNTTPFVLAQPRIGPDGEKLQPRVDPDGLYDAQRIVEGQPSTAIGSPSSYKSLAVTETGKVPFTGSIGLSVEGSMDTENAKYLLRIKLRVKAADINFVNLKLLAQYFAKNQNSGAIQETPAKFALIPSLGAKSVTCELKPSDLPFATGWHFRNGAYVEDHEGLAGVIVSVFSPDDKLLAQVTSASTLKDRGKTAFELPATWMDSDQPSMRRHKSRPMVNGN